MKKQNFEKIKIAEKKFEKRDKKKKRKMKLSSGSVKKLQEIITKKGLPPNAGLS
jgi:hypothetical protein